MQRDHAAFVLGRGTRGDRSCIIVDTQLDAASSARDTFDSPIMSGETEIEVSVVSEEDLELEGSRSSSTPAELLLREEKNGKSGCGLNNHHSFSFDVGKPALRPACNPQYTSFSISSILGRPESPPIDSTSTVSAERQSSDVDRGSPLPHNAQNAQRIGSSCDDSPARGGLSSPTSLRFSGGQRGASSLGHAVENRSNSMGIGCATSTTSPASTFSPPTDAAANPLLGHQASADLAMLSRYVRFYGSTLSLSLSLSLCVSIRFSRCIHRLMELRAFEYCAVAACDSFWCTNLAPSPPPLLH